MPVATAPRSDIQALRGLAVLLVIFQHAKAGFLPAGYLGVDIFFVISGYLITGNLAREHARGGIRFGAFYFRRARRLLPRVAGVAIVCVATAIVILRRHDALDERPIPNALAKVGDASYSLYLVHWPVFAFLNNAYAGDPSFGKPSTAVRSTCVGVSLLLGFFLHRWVEAPCRRVKVRSPRRWVALAVVASALLAVVPPGIAARSSNAVGDASLGVDFIALRQDSLGFGAACEGYRRFDAPAMCRNAPSPRMLVWGDSFAMHLVDGLAATSPGGVLQATKSACGPLLGIAQVTVGADTRDYARN